MQLIPKSLVVLFFCEYINTMYFTLYIISNFAHLKNFIYYFFKKYIIFNLTTTRKVKLFLFLFFANFFVFFGLTQTVPGPVKTLLGCDSNVPFISVDFK